MIKNPVPWPDGKKCAVAFTFDMDTDSLIHLEHPDDGFRRVSGISMLKYGPEVAVPRIVDTYRQFGIQQTFFVPAWCIENYPSAVKAMVDGGHEVAHHGYPHEILWRAAGRMNTIGSNGGSESSRMPPGKGRGAGVPRYIIFQTIRRTC